MADPIKELKVKIALVTTDFKKGLTDAKQQTEVFSKSSKAAFDVVRTAILGVTGALTGIGIAAAKEFKDTEKALAKVNTLLDLSEKESKDYADAIKTGARESGMAYDDFAEAVYQAISAGVDYEEAIKFVNETNKLAKGGFTDLTMATDITTTVLNAYGLEAKDQQKVMDLLIQTQNKGKTTVNELGSSLGNLIPIAQSVNLDFENVSASMAILTAGGISTAESTTYLKSMLNEMGKSGTKVSEIIQKKTGKSFRELMDEGYSLGDVLAIVKEHADITGVGMSDLFGSSEAATAAMSLLKDGTDAYNDVLGQMNESQGSTNEAFNTMNSTIDERLNQAINNMKNEFADLGSMFMNEFGDSVVSIIDSFSAMVDKISDVVAWCGEHKQLLTVLGIALATATTAILAYNIALNATTIVTTIATTAGAAFGAVMAFITSPITIVIGIIGALIAVIYLLVTNWDFLKTKTLEIWDNIKTSVINTVDNIKTSILTGFETAKNWCFEKFDAIKNGIQNKIEWARDKVKSAIDKIKSFFNFEWSLPKIKLPHFKISGSFSLNPPSVPSFGIDWYSNGGIFTKKTILPNGVGVGDAINGTGNAMEAVLPLDRLPELLGLDNQQNTGTQTTNIFVELDGNVIARAIGEPLLDTIRLKTGYSF